MPLTPAKLYRVERLTGDDAHPRLVVKSFATSDAMHAFLDQGDNVLFWHISGKGLRPGTYVFCADYWRDVRTLDRAILLAI